MIRSAIYIPGDHDRAMAKAPQLRADMLIFDLEDGVAPEKKAYARAAIQALVNDEDYESDEDFARKMVLVRVNHRSTEYYLDDLAAIAEVPLHGVMLSKVADCDDVDHACEALAQHDRGDLSIWCNVETPLGISNAFSIAAHRNVRGLVAGTNDLANDLRIRRTPDRAGLMHSLQTLQLAARAHHIPVLDGTFIDFEDMDGLRAEAEQGRILGFDGKTLVHPKQIDIANEVFGPTGQDIAEAWAIIEAYEAAMRDHKAVIVLNGKMIERLHYERAKEIISLIS